MGKYCRNCLADTIGGRSGKKSLAVYTTDLFSVLTISPRNDDELQALAEQVQLQKLRCNTLPKTNGWNLKIWFGRGISFSTMAIFDDFWCPC